jgi:hypothetical protein
MERRSRMAVPGDGAAKSRLADPLCAIEAARLKLASIILSFPQNEIRDAEQIKQSSLQSWRFSTPPSRVSSPGAGE